MAEQLVYAQQKILLTEKRRILLEKIENALSSGTSPQLEPQYKLAAGRLREQLGIVLPTTPSPVLEKTVHADVVAARASGNGREPGKSGTQFEFSSKDPNERREEMKSMLVAKEGVTFHPKTRSVAVPVVDEARLRTLGVHDEDIDYVIEISSYPREFLEGSAIFDRWGLDDEGRTAWRQSMITRYGDIFEKVYHEPNQLTRALMGSVSGAFANLSDILEKNGENDSLTRYLRSEAARLRAVMYRYHTIPIEGRLEIVEIHENSALEGLKKIFGTDNTRPMMIT